MRLYTCPIDEKITTPCGHSAAGCPCDTGCNRSSVQSCPCPIVGFLGYLLTLVDTPILHVAKRKGTQQVERQVGEKEQSLWLWLSRWQLMTRWQGKDKRTVDGCEVIILNKILRAQKLKSQVSLKVNCLTPSFYK